MIAIPAPVADARNLADWLELRALIAADHNASVSDLRRALTAIGGDNAIETARVDATTEAQDETYALSALSECEDRSNACGGGYPFAVDGSLLKLKDIANTWSYLFCLLLSLEGADRGEVQGNSTAMFEEVSEIAARIYVAGRSVKFGFPRRVLPKTFIAAVDKMCSQLGEGQGCKKRPSSKSAKDARLDIVAWRPFPDKRPAQLMLFGQCAAGGNWMEKISDLQPRNFTDLYWIDAPHVDPIKGFFTPFRLPVDNWDVNSKRGGIVFDRCRIAHLAFGETPPPGVLAWNAQIVEDWKT